MNQYLYDDDYLIWVFGDDADPRYIRTLFSRYEEYSLYQGTSRAEGSSDYTNYAKVYIRADTKRTEVKRKYQKVMEFYADASSLLIALYEVLIIIFNHINQFWAEQTLSKRIFFFKDLEENGLNLKKRASQIQELLDITGAVPSPNKSSQKNSSKELLINKDNLNDLKKKDSNDIDVPISIKIAVDEMEDLGLINITANNKLEVTKYGRATSVSFLSIEEAEFIKNTLNDYNYLKRYVGLSPMYKKKDKYDKLKVLILAMALDLEMFENAYLSSVIHNQISNALKIKFSTRLFAESTLDIISSGEAIEKVDKKFQDALIALQSDFMQCRCQDRPFCSCMQRGISEVIVHERLKGKDPQDISNKLFRKYQIQVYPGDIFSWLDNFVKNLDAIRRIAKAYNRQNFVKKTNYLIKKIENGWINVCWRKNINWLQWKYWCVFIA